MENWQEIKHRATHVHSLLTFGSIDVESTKSIVDFLRNGARLPKVLDMRHSRLAKFPRQIAKLRHLTYLSLRGTNVEKIPKSIGDLQMLETLDLKNTKVRELPDEILKLHRLRHLLVYWGILQGFRALKGIEKLSCLQKLCSIELQESNNVGILRDIAKLTQLKKINILHLRSTDANELCLTLQKLTELRSLRIHTQGLDETFDLEPLSSPPQFLHTLDIEAPMEKLPQWIPSLYHLAKLVLNVKEDPLPQLQDMPNLTCLPLRYAYEGESLSFKSGTFKQLTTLDLDSLDGLKRVSVMEGAMPLLKELSIGNCPLMEELPSGIETLSCLAVLDLFEMSDKLISKLRSDVQNENSLKIAQIPLVLVHVRLPESRRPFYDFRY